MIGKIRIEGDGSPKDQKTKVFLNDKEVTHFCQSLVLKMDLESPIAHVTLGLVTTRPDIPDELRAAIMAAPVNE